MHVFLRNHRRGLSAALIAAIGACALWLGYLAGWGGRAPSADAQPAAQSAALDEIRLPPDYPLRNPALDLAETTARPLFNASRRPLAGEAQGGSTASGAWQRGRYILTGVSIGPDKRVALLLEVATNKTVRVEQNQETGGMLVESVTPGKVILKRGTEREEISLKIAPAPKLAAAPVPKPDDAAAARQAPSPYAPSLPVAPIPPADPAVPGVAQSAADIANADPITEADVAERAARVEARRSRRSATGGASPR